VTLVDLPTLLRESDVVTLHVPLSPETEGMIGERELRGMKPNAFLINTARGAVIDEDALCRAIEERWIAGAALDVFRQEPLPEDSPLRRLDPDRVLLMPHATSNTAAARSGTQQKVVESVLEIAAGRVPELALNPRVTMRSGAR
jgi:glyoxylate reductase